MKSKCLASLIAVLLLPSLADAGSTSAQENQSWTARPRFEVFASVAMGHVFRFEDRGFGNHLNFGVGLDLRIWRGLRAGAEINHTFGLTPKLARTGGILTSSGQPMPYVGTARDGISSATAGSVTAAYVFGEGRIQPYLVGGISVLRAKEYGGMSIVHLDYIELKETQMSSTGVGPTFGAGLRASVNRHISIRPEIRFSDGTALSSLNLSQWRISLSAAYGW